MEDYSHPNYRREVKTITVLGSNEKVKKDNSISVLKVFKNIIVIGSNSGSVRFYDFRFRIICWFEDIDLGKIYTISFSRESESSE